MAGRIASHTTTAPIFGLVMLLLSSGAARSIDSYCDLSGYDRPLRQTLLVIDGRVVRPEPDGKLIEENRIWRRFVVDFLAPDNPAATQRLAPRERVTVSVAEPSGTGLKHLFDGCVPLYSQEEEAELAADESAVSTFFGRGWKANLESAIESFERKLILALAQGADIDFDLSQKKQPFSSGSLVSALANGTGLSGEHGIPRIVVYTDLSLYEMPSGNIGDARRRGRIAAQELGMNLGGAETHVLGVARNPRGPGAEHVRALLLAGRGKVVTMSGPGGSIESVNPPQSVRVYQGRIRYPDGQYPMRMRLALDRNGTAVNSWVEVQSDQTRFVPFGGLLTCQSEADCSFVGDRVFAQIWRESSGPNPEFANWMPFAGFRDFEFELGDERLKGRIHDPTGYVPGMESGLEFDLKFVENGRF